MLVWVLAAVLLSPPFGEAAATAEPGPGDGMTVRVSVVVDDDPTVVVARLVFADGAATAVALVPGEGGAWTGSARVARRENARVAFEAIDADGSSTASAPTTLTALGAAAAVVSPRPPAPEPSPEPGRVPWGWLGLVTGAASLVLLGAWARLDKRSDLPDDTGITG